MKVTYFQQVPYRELPDDFEKRYAESVITTPYFELTEPAKVHTAFRNALDEIMHAARAGFDGIAITEHGQSCYDMAPNPSCRAAALAYATEAEGLDRRDLSRSDDRWARPASRCGSPRNTR